MTESRIRLRGRQPALKVNRTKRGIGATETGDEAATSNHVRWRLVAAPFDGLRGWRGGRFGDGRNRFGRQPPGSQERRVRGLSIPYWDFAVETSDFEALAQDLPALVAPLAPLGQQWEPMGHFPVYQVFLRGPTKVEYLFLDRSQDPLPPLEPSRDTLPAINTHFWDWIWWLTTKASIGRSDLVAEHMPQLYTQLLRPMGISAVPATIESAVEAFVARRDALEQQFGISVDRALEGEVRQGIARVLGPR
jgi:hypothetical protein